MASDNPLGLPTADHPDGCDERGWVSIPSDDGGYNVRCSGCEHDMAIEKITGFVPPRFRRPIDLPDPVANWIDRGRHAEGLYFTGPVGSGKTHAAYMATARWCVATKTLPRLERNTESSAGGSTHHGPTVAFVRATTLFDELRPGSDGTRQRIVDCQRAALLVLDDLGAEKPSEWTCEKLYEIVDERYAQARPLIITSNVPPAKLNKHVGERVASRLAEMCTVAPVVGDDRRRAR